MPVIDISERSGWDDLSAGIQSGMQMYMQMSALNMQKERNAMAQKIAQQNLDWKQEDRAREQGYRVAGTQFAQMKMDGYSSPADINTARAAEGRDELMQSGAAQQGAQGVATRMAAGMMGGGSAPQEWLGSMNGVEYETPIAMKQAEERKAALSDVLSRLSPEAQHYAGQHFEQEMKRDIGLAMQTDVSKHLRATLRRNKMPGMEEQLAALIEAVDGWDPATGEGGVPPSEVEGKFIALRKEYSDDQNDMRVTESNLAVLSGLAQSGGLEKDSPKAAAAAAILQGYANGTMNFAQAQSGLMKLLPGTSDMMDDLGKLKYANDMRAAEVERDTYTLPGSGEGVLLNSGIHLNGRGRSFASLSPAEYSDFQRTVNAMTAADPRIGEFVEWGSEKVRGIQAEHEAMLRTEWGLTDGPAQREPRLVGLNLEMGLGPTWTSLKGGKLKAVQAAIDEFVRDEDLTGLQAKLVKLGVDPKDVPTEVWTDTKIAIRGKYGG